MPRRDVSAAHEQGENGRESLAPAPGARVRGAVCGRPGSGFLLQIRDQPLAFARRRGEPKQEAKGR